MAYESWIMLNQHCQPHGHGFVDPFLKQTMATAQVVEDLLKRILNTETQTSELLEEVQRLEEVSTETEGSGVTPPQVLTLRTTNAKLSYQIKHLKDSIEAENARGMKHMTNVLSVVGGLFSTAVRTLHPGYKLPKAFVQWNGGKFGDYKCNVMALAQELKAKGQSTPPREVASQVLSQLRNHESFLDKFEVAGPGFINISLKASFVSELVTDLLVGGVRPPPLQKQLRVVVDFSSPNIAKEMHVGHLRSTIIGETVCRLLEFAGHDVLRLNHLGDWGTQFGMLITHLKDRFPNYLQVSPPIGDLQAFYKESKVRFDGDDEFKARAYANVVSLQNHDPDVIKAWQLICDVSRKGNQEVYNRLGVTIIERGESFYQPFMPDVVQDLEDKGLLLTEEGRKVMYVDGFSIPLTVVKSDGGYTYATSDLAALRHRVEVEKGDWLIYVVDAGQALHLNSVFKGGLKAGYCSENTRIDHMGFGVVLGEDKKKFKTRSGDTVRLLDLLDEGLERSLATLEGKKRNEVLTTDELQAAQTSVAYGCIKYADLCHTYTHDYVFSFNKMLEDRGNTAVYLLYAYTRIRSIARLANVTPEQLREAALTTPIDLSHEKELKLAKCLIRFPEIISRILDDLYPHLLCDYTYELCTTFTGFYDACYCVEKDRQTGEIIKVNMSRLLLCEATAMVLGKAFSILGLDPVAKM